ncbi:class I SAM-dependent methyltransferase [Mesorhizobium sp. BAC0120]|uniref:class I SAM-dependent methyltransferase n=1 Tax=Mesorhizobium sp. BAC0120 TaxID=3090670 RepID=UPI00298D17E7|nr:class I SAM-dependent methyltransferase [Mesorhizobium sp. BAC0120]MDW6025600.1 class I SAM-dependent methyltransferase [Mesorhizobium sp. BAC0120]
MTRLTRLEKLLFRLEAQHVCLDWAFREIAGRPGIVFEMGLGHGRTYDHLRTNLPDREIYVFDREVDSYEDCTPPADRMMLGEITETLDDAASRFGAEVVLAHADMGSYDRAHNIGMSAKLSRYLPPVLAPGAIVLSDLPLELPGTRALPLPPGAREGRYFLYRNEL